MDQRKIRIGDAIVYHNEVGRGFSALVTAIHCAEECGEDWAMTPNPEGHSHPGVLVNVVFVSGDLSRTDSYGRQIERSSSVPHAREGAHGFYWRFEDEKPNPVKPSVI